MTTLELTYDDVALHAEMSRSTVIKIIRNQANPTHDSICRIARVLKIQEAEFTEYFFSGIFDQIRSVPSNQSEKNILDDQSAPKENK